MGNQPSAPGGTPLRCILQNWSRFDPATLQKRRLIFFCNTVWHQYHLWDGESWPLNGTINYNTILQLGLFCKRQGKRSEIPYVQLSFILQDSQDLLTTCKLTNLATLLPKENLSISPATSPPSSAPLPYKGPPLPPSAKVCPMVEAPGGKFGPQLVHKPFSIVELKQIKAELGSFPDNPLNIPRDSNILLWLMK